MENPAQNVKFKVPIDAQQSNALGEYRRFEDKYIVQGQHQEQVISTLYRELTPSYPIPGTQYTLIESLYFDSPELDFYRHHFMSLPTRYKMRVRRYGPNGEWAKQSMLEVKRKRDGESKKTRFMISPDNLESFAGGQLLQVNSQLKGLNRTIKSKTLVKRVGRVNQLLQDFQLQPVLRIQYHRLAFERDGFRVTVDRKLRGEVLRPIAPSMVGEMVAQDIWEKATRLWEKLEVEQNFVLEFKHQGNVPQWGQELIEQLDFRKTSFSKYCWFITDHLKQQANAVGQAVPEENPLSADSSSPT